MLKKHGITVALGLALFALGLGAGNLISARDLSLADNSLVYLLAHNSREAADASWAAFAADPEWQRVAEESQRDGKILEKMERIYLDATDYSQMK